MVHLLSFPNEILYRIIDFVNPGDLGNFSTSCPLLESLAKDALDVHHMRERWYTNIYIHGCHRESSRVLGGHPLKLLSEICETPQVAWYPRSLTVTCCGSGEMEHRDGELEEDEYLEEASDEREDTDKWRIDAVFVRETFEDCSKQVEKLIFDSGYFKKEHSKRWYNHIRRGNRGAALGLLLTLLPNLEVIKSTRYTWKAPQLKKIIRRITTPCARIHRKPAEVLPKLRQVELCGTDIASFSEAVHVSVKAFEDFDLAAYFAKLPSMRRIHVSPACSRSPSSNNPWTEVGPRASSIDEIFVRQGEMDAIHMTHCLASIKALRRFHYYDGPLWGVENTLCRSGVVMILGALLEHAKTSLEVLNLDSWPFEDDAPTSISLEPFEKLKDATLSGHLFATAFIPPKSTRRKTKPLHTGSDHSGLQSPTPLKAPRLVDILPRSIVAIEFLGLLPMENIEAMLQGLSEHRADRLPLLEKVEFYAGRSLNYEIAGRVQKKCERLGIQLVL